MNIQLFLYFKQTSTPSSFGAENQHFFFFLVHQLKVGQGRLMLEVCGSHTATHQGL
jgi:hypothetical protein